MMQELEKFPATISKLFFLCFASECFLPLKTLILCRNFYTLLESLPSQVWATECTKNVANGSIKHIHEAPWNWDEEKKLWELFDITKHTLNKLTTD